MRSKLKTISILNGLQESIKFWCDYIKTNYFKRNRKIQSHHILMFILKFASNYSAGYDLIISDLFMNLSNNLEENRGLVSKSSMSEAWSKVPINILENIHYDLVIIIRKQWKGRRILAIDGSQAVVSGELDNYFKINGKDYYPTSYISYVYDIGNRIPLHAYLYEKQDERKAVLAHLHVINKGDIVVMDRGYYGKELLKLFHDRGIFYVFRIKKDNFTEEWDTDDNDFQKFITFKRRIKLQLNLRFIKYNLGKNKYMIMTNLCEKKFTYEFIQKIYKERWRIETSYRYAKTSFSIAKYHSRRIKRLRDEFHASFLLLTVARILEYYCIEKSNKRIEGGWFSHNVFNNQKINFKKCIYLIVQNIHRIFHPLQQIEVIFIDLVKHVLKSLISIREKRHYCRYSKYPQNKWNSKRKLSCQT